MQMIINLLKIIIFCASLASCISERGAVSQNWEVIEPDQDLEIISLKDVSKESDVIRFWHFELFSGSVLCVIDVTPSAEDQSSKALVRYEAKRIFGRDLSAGDKTDFLKFDVFKQAKVFDRNLSTYPSGLITDGDEIVTEAVLDGRYFKGVFNNPMESEDRDARVVLSFYMQAVLGMKN